MAAENKTEYQIIYTYSGQSNFSGPRTVPFSKFALSGDTDKFIGQITGISYEHWHTSTGSRTWALRCRLIFGDGAIIDSDVDSRRISGESVKFTNGFSALPDADMLKLLTAVQTINESGAIDNEGYSAKLYWRATSDKPMRLVIRFIEQPPVYYAPEIKNFSLQRCNADGLPDDEGSYLAAGLQLGLGLMQGLDHASLRIYYAANAYPDVNASPHIDLSGRIPELIEGAVLNPTLIPGRWAVGSSWYFAAVFTAGDEQALATATAPRARGSLHISGEPCGGLAVCGYSTGTSAQPKFETYAPAYLYGGIAQLGPGEASLLPSLGIQWGAVEDIRVASGGTADIEIAFDAPYAAPPVVIPALYGAIEGSSAGGLSAVVRSVSASGCIIRLASTTTTYTVALHWLAAGSRA